MTWGRRRSDPNTGQPAGSRDAVFVAMTGQMEIIRLAAAPLQGGHCGGEVATDRAPVHLPQPSA